MESFSVDKFFDEINSLEICTAFDIAYIISRLDSREKEIVLKDERIKKIVGIGILEESTSDFYYGFEYILRYLKPSELLSLYDADTIKDFFKKDYSGHEYKLFASCMNKDKNDTIKYILSDEEMFKLFFSLNGYFYSTFYNIDYDLFKEIIFKLEKMKFPYRTDFISCVGEDNQRKIIKESISDDTLVIILKECNNKNGLLSDFFKNDVRAKYLYDRFNLARLIDDEVEFNIDILRNRVFFNLIKGKSFIEFREAINKLERNNEVNIIEKRVNEYHEEIINSFDFESGMFKVYKDYLEDPSKVERKKFDYIYDGNIWGLFREYIIKDYDTKEYYCINKEELKDKLIKETSYRLSEVIIDALFQDNIYNVWLNIKEMLRYNEKLDEKVISPEWIDFYKVILEIDKVSNSQKIEMYHKLKNQNINVKFYDDLRKLKDISYDMIKKDLLNINDNIECDKKLSEEYNVTTYDYRDKEFTLLIRGKHNHRGKTGNRRNCYSIISNENSDVFGHNSGSMFYYGYNSFENDRVTSVLERDSFSYDAKKELTTKYVNRLMTSKELVTNDSWYSELNIVNIKEDDGKYKSKTPDYLVVFEKVEERHIKEAQRLGIPIVLINLKYLDREKYHEYEIPFDKEHDIYVSNEFDEKKMRGLR